MERALTITGGDCRYCWFAPEDQLLYLVSNLSKDWYSRVGLLKYLDVWKFMQTERLDWDLVVTRARQYGLTDRLFFGLYYTSVCFPHAPLSTELLSAFGVRTYQKAVMKTLVGRRQLYAMVKLPRLVRAFAERLLWHSASYTRPS
jgi:hypothetical protein